MPTVYACEFLVSFIWCLCKKYESMNNRENLSPLQLMEATPHKEKNLNVEKKRKKKMSTGVRVAR